VTFCVEIPVSVKTPQRLMFAHTLYDCIIIPLSGRNDNVLHMFHRKETITAPFSSLEMLHYIDVNRQNTRTNLQNENYDQQYVSDIHSVNLLENTSAVGSKADM